MSGHRWRRPLLHLVVALVPWPLTLLAARDQPAVPVPVPVPVPVLVGCAAAAAVGGLLWRRAAQARRSRERLTGQVELERAEQVLEQVYTDWLDLEAARGLAELERWRRTRSS